ncbi:hypothetical protein ID866_12398 [Astraeus odoratus]|nr:hypothetical protein ID866_12398 [Astraeus odoratus]
MSSITNSNNNSSSTSAPSITSDWTTVSNAQLNWDDNDMEEVATAKFQERCWCKKIWEAEECKCQEEEKCHKAEEAEQRCKAEEARACTATEEKQKCEEAAIKECTKNNLPCKVVMGVKKRSVCVGCMKLKEKCEKKKRARKSTMVDDEAVVEGWKMGQQEAGGSDTVAEAIHELMRELTGRLDMLTSGILKELQGQSNVLENLIKTQQNFSQKMSQHYAVLEDMLGELEVFAANPGELLEEEDVVDEEDLKEVRGELEGLGPIVNMEEEMEGEQQGENQGKGKGKERAE